jgi:hypothetical protein
MELGISHGGLRWGGGALVSKPAGEKSHWQRWRYEREKAEGTAEFSACLVELRYLMPVPFSGVLVKYRTQRTTTHLVAWVALYPRSGRSVCSSSLTLPGGYLTKPLHLFSSLST